MNKINKYIKRKIGDMIYYLLNKNKILLYILVLPFAFLLVPFKLYRHIFKEEEW